MSLRLGFRAAARAELVAAVAWYEAQRPGLGTEFLAEMDRCLMQIAQAPEQCPLVHRELRRAALRRFPYCVYFHVELQRIVVLAVFHGSRDPATWQRRR